MTIRGLPVAAATLSLSTVLLIVLGACDNAEPPAAPGSPTESATEERAGSLPQGSEPVELDPADFTPRSDHPYFPLEPGRQWIYREIDEDGTVVRVVVTVSSETKRIANGVEAAVVRDTVTEDGQLIEDTLDWYAQDTAGNVWYLGENTAEFEDGKLTTREGSFEAGVDGALAGVIMPADPEVGLAYRQEYYKGEAEDNGSVLALGQQAQVPAGHFEDVLVTTDTIALEPKVLEFKFYARGVGTVLALGISGGGGREELIDTRTVSDQLARQAGTSPLGTPYL